MATRSQIPPEDLPMVERADTTANGAPVSSLATIQDDDAEESSIVERMRAVLATSAADRVKVKVYKRNKASGKMDWCRDYLPAEFEEGDLEAVRQEWGPGDYEFRVINSSGIAARSVQTLAAPAITAPSVKTGATSELAQVLQSMQETQTRMLEAITQRPAVDPMADMARMMQMATMMREAFGINAQPAAQPIDQMQMIDKVFAMVKNAKAAVKELADEETPEKEPGDPVMASLPKLLDIVGGALKQNPQPQSAGFPAIQLPPSVEQPTQHATPLAADPAQQTMPQPESPEQMILRGYVEDLCEMAARNDDPEKGAELIADKLPDELLDHLDNRYWFELTAQLFPQITPHKEWLTKARNRALELLNEPGDDAP